MEQAPCRVHRGEGSLHHRNDGGVAMDGTFRSVASGIDTDYSRLPAASIALDQSPAAAGGDSAIIAESM
jgi:hypothetical protein